MKVQITLTVSEAKRMIAKGLAQQIKGAGVSGTMASLEECAFPNDKCKNHLACIYKRAEHP